MPAEPTRPAAEAVAEAIALLHEAAGLAQVQYYDRMSRVGAPVGRSPKANQFRHAADALAALAQAQDGARGEGERAGRRAGLEEAAAVAVERPSPAYDTPWQSGFSLGVKRMREAIRALLPEPDADRAADGAGER